MSIYIRNQGLGSFQLLYASRGFHEGLEVTGYLIYPNKTKSNVEIATELGDGIYSLSFPYERQTLEYEDKYGIVVKENGTTRYFGTILMINA